MDMLSLSKLQGPNPKNVRRHASEIFKINNIVIDVDKFKSWQRSDELKQIVIKTEQGFLLNKINVEKDGVRISRVHEDPDKDKVLGAYILHWEELFSLANNHIKCVGPSDASLHHEKTEEPVPSIYISVKNLIKLMRLKDGCTVKENNSQIGPTDHSCPKCENTLVRAEGRDICIECGYTSEGARQDKD
ncbi:MAG: hypothetical protein KGH61_01775 [Candidatus Micrarchaeota archaeon]|nr:hypothetical protein [Candidatus Micrarchaeota archaeon]MDE1847659.1 hypothetical protein [Candidatus Micrarchaeota archaeon]MDE1864480.1 hypothetical protein [Candidatus Micrarchaeota archaeon]